MRALVSAAAAALLLVGCADLLGFKTFTERDGGSGVDGGLGTVEAGAAGAGVDGAQPPAGSEGGVGGGGCIPACGAGQKCDNGACVCDPATCAGCCSGTACSTSWPGCGTGGGACTACDGRTDRCDSSGQCACGQTGACAQGQRCLAGGCTCDPTSCATTCCGTSCIDTTTDGKNCGSCGHDCQGTTCSGGLCQPQTLSTGGTTAWNMAISPTTAYWVSTSGVYSCPLTGCAGSPAGPFGAASYTFSNEDRVAYVNTGGTPLVVATGQTPSTSEIFRMNADGSGLVQIIGASAGGWTVDGTNVIWWAGGDLTRRPIAVGVIEIVLSGVPDGTSVATDANNVYVATTVQVLACPKATGQCGSNATVIASANSPDLLVTEPDSQYVYYSNTSAIFRCPFSGCADPNNVSAWASGQESITALTSDSSGIYWTDQNKGTVMKCPYGPTCTAPTTVAAGLSKPTGIAVDAQWVYFTQAAGGVALAKVAK